jgi:hypothetical protein
MSEYSTSIAEKWVAVNKMELSFTDTMNSLQSVTIEGISGIRMATTVDHPVACIHAVSATHSDPLQWLLSSQQNLADRLHPLREKQISSDVLHYFVLVRTEESVGGRMDARINELFSAMCRHFGHNTSQLIIHRSHSMESDYAAWEGLMKTFVSNSLAPFMYNFVTSGVKNHGMRSPIGLGLANKLFSVGKKWLTPSTVEPPSSSAESSIDKPDFLVRRAAEFSFLLGDWSGALHQMEEINTSSLPFETSLSLRILKVFTMVALGNPPDFYAKEIEAIVELAERTPECAVDAIAFALRFFAMAPNSLNENSKLAILVRLAMPLSDPHIQTLVYMKIGQLYISVNWYRRALLSFYHAVIQSSELIHLKRLFFNELVISFEARPMRFEKGSLSVELGQMYLDMRPDPNMSLKLLNSYGGLLESDTQEALISILHMKTGPGLVKFIKILERDSFLSTGIQEVTNPINISGEIKLRVKELCDNVSLVTCKKVNFEEVWSRYKSVVVVGTEKLNFRTVLRNVLSIPVQLNHIELELISYSGTTHRTPSENKVLEISPQVTLEVSLCFTPNFVGAYKLKYLHAMLRNFPVTIEIDTRFQRLNSSREERISKIYADNPRLCVRKEVCCPRLQVSLDGLPEIIYVNQDILATIIVSNTGEIDARDVTVFALGIANFPASGINVGDIPAGDSCELPTGIQPEVGDPLVPIIFAAESSALSQGAFWTCSKTAQDCLRISLHRIASPARLKILLLVTVENVSENFLVDVRPRVLKSGMEELLSLPECLDLPPSHKGVFAFEAPHYLFGSEQLLSIDCTIAGEKSRFCYPLGCIDQGEISTSKEVEFKRTLPSASSMNMRVIESSLQVDNSEYPHEPWDPKQAGPLHPTGTRSALVLFPPSLIQTDSVSVYFDQSENL